MPRKKTTGQKAEKKVTRCTYDEVKEPRTPETGHTPLLPADEQVVTLAMENSGWSKPADSGYVSAWYLDEDYDGDCFVDCKMFFDFKKAPNIKAALRAEVDPEEFTLKLASEPFAVRGYQRIAVKVVDVYGNESTVVRELNGR
ncbi:MAG: hypothetical protein HY812_01975 [Planctomycetes bacterium]|nr:hypothetical protein [Planctomycetota bacterium]